MSDIQRQLDDELTAVPPSTFQISDTVIAGRSAVRRRRAALAGSTLAVALIAGGGAWLAADGDSATRQQAPGFATSPGSASTSQTPATAPAEGPTGPWSADEPLQVDKAGKVHIHPDAEVTSKERATVANGKVVLYEIQLRGEAHYAVVTPSGPLGWTKALPPNTSFKEFAQQSLVESQSDDSWVMIDPSGRLRPMDRVEILDQQASPGFGERFADASTPTAIAEVRRDGLRWFLAVRAVDGERAEAIPFQPSAAVDTLAEFLEHARGQYATNEQGGSEGLR